MHKKASFAPTSNHELFILTYLCVKMNLNRCRARKYVCYQPSLFEELPPEGSRNVEWSSVTKEIALCGNRFEKHWRKIALGQALWTRKPKLTWNGHVIYNKLLLGGLETRVEIEIPGGRTTRTYLTSLNPRASFMRTEFVHTLLSPSQAQQGSFDGLIEY